jgi:predicted RNase H-like nuclease (RuvC/YqgF family)
MPYPKSKESIMVEAVGAPGADAWAHYVKVLLTEIKEINNNVKNLEDRIADLKNDMITMTAQYVAKDDKLHELEEWKKKIDEVASPTQLGAMTRQVDELKTFKAKAITIFAVVQFGMAAALFLARFIK